MSEEKFCKAMTFQDMREFINPVFNETIEEETFENVSCDCTIDVDLFLAMIVAKYDLVKPYDISPIGIPNAYEELIINKLKELTDESNLFLASASSYENVFIFLLKCMGEPEVVPILKYINQIYNLVSKEFLKDMFYTMAIVLDAQTYVAILCELYIAHINFPFDVDTCSLRAIFNLLFKKESIEKMFSEVIYNNAPYELFTPENKNMVYRMMKAIAFLNNHKLYIEETYDRSYSVEDIFDVDEYIANAVSWVSTL